MPAKQSELIVVSGISGRFPECLNIKQFREKILAGECLVTHDDARWPLGTYDLPTGGGKVRRLEDFDATYFGYNDEQADLLDPLDRILITESYSAILDAGILPETLRGSNTGIFFGSFVDEVQTVLKDKLDANENIFQYHASRIHDALDFRGPTCWLENGCATSLTALQIAVNSIQNGLCDQALVCGVNITMDPTKVKWQMLYETLSHDSICHVFDKAACGYVKGEAAVAIFVQKKSQAKRIYSEILGIHCNTDGYKTDGFTHPGWRTQRDLMMGVMKKASISGKDYSYFEAHGTGTQAGDTTELRSIYEAICRDRDRQPLMIGSIKCITGHAEGASGLVSLSKIIIAYQTKIMAPNLNYNEPNPNIPQLTDGTYQVVVKPTPFEGGICGINNFGIGGGNASVVLSSYDEKKTQPDDYNICTPIPRLILAFGRNMPMVYETLNEIEIAIPNVTKGYLSLLNDISSMDPTRGMKSRGYLILDQDKQLFIKDVADALVKETNIRRPVWLVFSGLGSQWCSMANQLMNVNLFANSIHHSIKYLTSIGYDNDILRNFIIKGEAVDKMKEPVIVSIVVMQIALFDTIAQLGVEADGFVGHSVGEVAAAYADGCISKEEALQIAYTIEVEVVKVREIVPGMMAAVGLSFEEAIRYEFGTVSVACSNSADMVTMGGNINDMSKLINLLQSKDIFVRQVESNQIMAHTKFLQNSFERIFMLAFKRLSIKAKPRTSRFISTSFAEIDSDCELHKTPSADYFAHNILNPVWFHEAINKASNHTHFIEVGPTGQLKSSIIRSFKSNQDVKYNELIKKYDQNNLMVFLNTLGCLYASGQNLNLNQIYPKVSYPVARNTEFLSPIFRYDHSKSRLVVKYPEYFSSGTQSRSVYQETVSLSENYQYFRDHSVDGLVLYPATGYLYLAWKTISSYFGYSRTRLSPIPG